MCPSKLLSGQCPQFTCGQEQPLQIAATAMSEAERLTSITWFASEKEAGHSFIF